MKRRSSSVSLSPPHHLFPTMNSLNNNNDIDIGIKKAKIETGLESDSASPDMTAATVTTTSPVLFNGNGSTGSGSPPPASLQVPLPAGNVGLPAVSATSVPSPVSSVAVNGGSGDGVHHLPQQVQQQQQPPHHHGQPNGPSKVVHVRNIPNEANESDLINLGLPFGKITNLLLLKGKNQAFLEFADIAAAQCMVTYWLTNAVHAQPTVRGRHVFCQYSNHQQLKPHQNPHHNPAHHQQHPQQHQGVPGMDGQQHMHANGSSMTNGHSSPPNSGQSGETAVVRVVVDSLLYPVTLDTFYQLFSRFGKVNKIVTFTKNNSLQALVQFDGFYAAQSAKSNLDGQAMFGGASNILRVDFSKLTNLNVKYNNDKSRDYTNPLLPPGNTPPPYGGAAGSGDMNAGHHMTGLDPLTLAALSGHGHSLGFGSPHQQHAGLGAGQGQSAHHLTGFGAQQHNGNGNPGRQHNGGSNQLVAAASAAGLAAAHHALLGFGTVLLVSNLSEQMATPDALFTLFGVYGDVMRVKVLFNKKDNALIQMAEPQQASLALTYLDKLKLFAKPMRVTASKHGLVQLPKEGQPDSGLTKDFSNSPLHRFKKPGSKNYSNIYPPSATLHLSNIPPSVGEEQIREAFLTNMPPGTTIVNFKFFPKDKKMALIQLSSVEEAVVALIKMHNFQLGESSHLRVSFSKSSI